MDREYYKEMWKRDRAFPVYVEGKLKCFITFFIGNGNAEKYIRDDSWSVVDDEPKTGDTCYIDQCISDKNKKNYKYNKLVFGFFIDHIKKEFPQVKKMRWNRVKNDIVHVYKKEL